LLREACGVLRLLFRPTFLQHVNHRAANFVVTAIEAATARRHRVDAIDRFLHQGIETFFFDLVRPVKAMLLADTGSAQRTGAP